MRKIINRLKEPSTWAGFAALAVMFGVPPVAAEAVLGAANAIAGTAASDPHGVTMAVSAVFSALAIFLPEKKAVK
jgi:hypothetical protein